MEKYNLNCTTPASLGSDRCHCCRFSEQIKQSKSCIYIYILYIWQILLQPTIGINLPLIKLDNNHLNKKNSSLKNVLMPIMNLLLYIYIFFFLIRILSKFSLFHKKKIFLSTVYFVKIFSLFLQPDTNYLPICLSFK